MTKEVKSLEGAPTHTDTIVPPQKKEGLVA